MKHHNGVTNIGVLCGFAALNERGQLLVHQTSCREMAFVIDIEAAGRKPDFDYEPVTVLYRVTPGPDGHAVMQALHVSRMARHMQPKTFYWNSRQWPLNLEFYPFRKDQAGVWTDDLQDSLADEHDFPAWVHDAADADDTFAELLEGPTSKKHLTNRLVMTGYIVPGETIAAQEELKEPAYLRINFTLPNDGGSVVVRMTDGVAGYGYISNGPVPPGGLPSTLIIKPLATTERGADGAIQAAPVDLLMLSSNAVSHADIAAA